MKSVVEKPDFDYLLKILSTGLDGRVETCSCQPGVDMDRPCVNISYGNMYSPPELNLVILKLLSEFFGTDEIVHDSFSNQGCETCDWGSSYGHEITILNPKRNQKCSGLKPSKR